MTSVTATLAVGLAHHEAGRLNEAEQIYRRLIEVDPGMAEGWHLLGLIAYQTQRYEQALEYSRRALELKPHFPEELNNLGLILQHQKRLEEAAACYRRAIELHPRLADAHYNLARVLTAQGQFVEAIESYQRAIELIPNRAAQHINLANVFRKLGNLDAAAVNYRRALVLEPNSALAHYNLGVVLREQGKLADGIDAFRHAVAIQADFAEALAGLGGALAEQGTLEEAALCYQRASELEPSNANFHNSLGAVFEGLGELETAIACYERALELNPKLAEAHSNCGVVRFKQGRLDEAMTGYRQALAIDPDLAEAHFNLSSPLLIQGDFESGWSEYEWRWLLKDHSKRDFEQPRWKGEALAGKTILLHAEQGFGDTFQFVRYAAVIKNLGATVVFECQRPLRQLLTGCSGIDYLCSAGDELPSFDCHCPLLSLPTVLKTTLETIPSQVPYVFADPALIKAWHERLAPLTGFRIGINWHGRGGRGLFRQRDLPLEQFFALGSLPGSQLICLQKEIDDAESAQLAECPNIHRLGDDFDGTNGAFMDTAAVMKNLDLVITSDTAIAHLAGALGVPVWVVLPFIPNWRWLLDRSDSPWYPTMRLFRQQSPGDWTQVFAEIQNALQNRQ